MADSGPWAKYQAATPAAGAGPWTKFTKSTGVVSPPPAGAPAPVAGPDASAGATPTPGVNRSGSYQGTAKPTFDDFLTGAEAWARGASFDTSDDASAGLAAAILKAKGDPRAMYDIYKQLDAAENAKIDAYEKKNGKSAEYAGMVTGPGGIGRVAEWIGRGAGGLAKTARAALAGGGLGAIGGWGAAKPGEKTRGTMMGAATGAVAGPVVERAGSFVGPKISQAAQYLQSKGVRPTIGQNVGGAAKAAEEKLSSIPLVGDLIKNQQRAAIEDFNRAAYNEILAPLGKSVPKDFKVGNEGFAKVDDIISGEYQKLLPKLTFTADAQFKSDIAAVDALAAKLPKAQQRAYKDIMQTQIADKLDKTLHTMDGNTFKGAESELSGEIRGLSNDPSWDQKKLAKVLRSAQAVMRDSLERTNPAYAGQLQPINRATMLLKRVQDAVERVGAKDGVMMPTHLLSAAKGGATGKSFARGTAPFQKLAQAGDSTLSNKYPDSGSIGRLLLAEGGLGMVNPKAAAGVAGISAPYLLPRGWNASPFAQGAGSLLRQLGPRAAGQAGAAVNTVIPRYIGQQ